MFFFCELPFAMRSMRRSTVGPTHDAKGIHVSRSLGPQEFAELWDSIHVAPELKESLLCQSLLNFTLRPRVSRTVIPLHGVILLIGAPGTGKTSLRRQDCSNRRSWRTWKLSRIPCRAPRWENPKKLSLSCSVGRSLNTLRTVRPLFSSMKSRR